jgi:hypothetical protein
MSRSRKNPAALVEVFYEKDGVYDENGRHYPAGWYWKHPDSHDPDSTGTGPFSTRSEALANANACLLAPPFMRRGRENPLSGGNMAALIVGGLAVVGTIGYFIYKAVSNSQAQPAALSPALTPAQIPPMPNNITSAPQQVYLPPATSPEPGSLDTTTYQTVD